MKITPVFEQSPIVSLTLEFEREEAGRFAYELFLRLRLVDPALEYGTLRLLQNQLCQVFPKQWDQAQPQWKARPIATSPSTPQATP